MALAIIDLFSDGKIKGRRKTDTGSFDSVHNRPLAITYNTSG